MKTEQSNRPSTPANLAFMMQCLQMLETFRDNIETPLLRFQAIDELTRHRLQAPAPPPEESVLRGAWEIIDQVLLELAGAGEGLTDFEQEHRRRIMRLRTGWTDAPATPDPDTPALAVSASA